MPKMHIPWSFQPHDGRMYHTGVQDVDERHIKIALAQGATFINDGQATAGEVAAKPVSEVKPKKQAGEKKPNDALAEFNALVNKAKELGYSGSRKKEDVLAFLSENEDKPAEA